MLQEAKKNYEQGTDMAHSCYVLGMAYATGEGVEKDAEQARAYIMKAAELPFTPDNAEWVSAAWCAILENDIADEPTFEVTWQEVLHYARCVYEKDGDAAEGLRARSLSQIISTFCNHIDAADLPVEQMAAYFRDAREWPQGDSAYLLEIITDSKMMDLYSIINSDDMLLEMVHGMKPVARERAAALLALLEPKKHEVWFAQKKPTGLEALLEKVNPRACPWLAVKARRLPGDEEICLNSHRVQLVQGCYRFSFIDESGMCLGTKDLMVAGPGVSLVYSYSKGKLTVEDVSPEVFDRMVEQNQLRKPRVD